MGNVCQGGVGQAPTRQATIFAGKLYNICNNHSITFQLLKIMMFRIT